MKISKNTVDRLILDDVPWVRGIVIILVTIFAIGMSFREINSGRETGYFVLFAVLAMGLISFTFFFERYQILFLRPEGIVLKRKRSVFRFRETSQDLDQVSHAKVVETRDSDGGTMYHPVLVLRDGAKPMRLVDYDTTGWGPPELTEAINDWLGVETGDR